MIKSHTFRNKRWKILDAPPDTGGECQAPWMSRRMMNIPAHGEALKDLDTIIHESLHACLWDLDEEAISESAADVARLLWRLGWRKEL